MSAVIHTLTLPFGSKLLLCVVLAVLLPACGRGSAFVDRITSGPPIEVEASADVRIVPKVPARVARVRAIPQLLTLPTGGVAVLSASAQDSQGRLLSDVQFRWRLRDGRAGSITSNGVLTAGRVVGHYEDAIVVEAFQVVDGREFSAEGSASILVTSGQVDQSLGSVALFPRIITGRAGERIPMEALARGAAGGIVQDVNFQWSVETTAGQIDQKGLVTLGNTPGFYQDAIQVQARRITGTSAPVTATSSVRILTDVEASSGLRAIIGPASVTGRPGDSISLILLAFDGEGVLIPVDRVTWEVSDPQVATISSRGKITLNDAPGTYPAIIQATASLGGAFAGKSITATADLAIQTRERPLLVQGIPGHALINPEAIRVKSGERAALTFIYFDSLGRPGTEEAVTWSVDPALAEIDEEGRVRAIGEPGAYPGAVRAVGPEVNGIRTQAEATLIILGQLSRVVVIPSVALVDAASVTQFSAQAFDSAGTRLFDVAFRWRLEGAPGTITSDGLFVAGDSPGNYVGAVRVKAVQRR